MSRVILTTCGTSLFTSNCWKDVSSSPSIFQLKSPNKEDQEKCYRDFTMRYKNNDPSGESLAKKFDIEVWQDSSKITWLPAELASLKVIKLFCENNNIPLSSSDKLILLHADNEDAIYCANVIHKVLTINKLLNDVMIESLWKVNELDPANVDIFRNSMERLWVDLAKKMPYQENIRYYLNLTGGYKATVMLFACIAYAKGFVDAYIFYLNEESGLEVLVMCFNPQEILEGRFSSLRTSYIEPDTGRLKGSITPQDLS